jgi:hypothetical protein
MTEDQEWEDEYEDESLLDEEEDQRGRLQLIASHAMDHPRLACGGGSLILSLTADVIAHLDPLVVVMGIAATVVIGWNGETLVKGIQQLLPGSDQAQVQEDADRFADHFLHDYPVYADQSLSAKIRRLFRLEEGEVVEEPLPPLKKREVTKGNGPHASIEAFTYERIATWLEQRIINDRQFFILLRRIDEGKDEGKNRHGNGTTDEHEAPSEADVSPSMEPLRPAGWTEEKISQLTGAFLATGHLDNSLKALGLSTSQRNRDFARETLKQQGLWKEK